jgi:hypothetical protein
LCNMMGAPGNDDPRKSSHGVSLAVNRYHVPQFPIHNPELHRLYQKVDQLSDEDQRALVILLDSLVKRSRVSQVMGEI